VGYFIEKTVFMLYFLGDPPPVS